jgi:hypothetical protein
VALTKTSWAVTGQVTGQTMVDAANNVVVGSYIYFTTGQGNQCSIFVPDSKVGNESYVKGLIRAEALLRDNISLWSENT